MGDTLEREAITEALTIIDEALAKAAQRDLISSVEVADLLLDVRLLLSGVELAEPVPN
jgi:hypothetical protein